MKKRPTKPKSDDMLVEYDFRGGVRGKYYVRAMEAAGWVRLDPDIASFFADSESVNQALRVLLSVGSKRRKRTEERTPTPARGRKK